MSSMLSQSRYDYGIVWIGFLAGLVLFQACGKPSQPTVLEEQSANAEVSPTPSPLPSPTPVPTPALAGPNFFGIRANRDLMLREPEKLTKYSKNLSGKTIDGWVGRIMQIQNDPGTGLSRLLVEMDLEEKDPRYILPDTVLQSIPSTVADQLQTGQIINFGGVIEGFIHLEPYKNILSVRDVNIFGYLEAAASEIQDATRPE